MPPTHVIGPALGLALLLAIATGCASPLVRGENLYRQGDVRGALAAWRSVPEGDSEFDRVQSRLRVVEGEFERTLLRYEKRAAFFESEGRLAEAVLYYRLTLKLDPARTGLLERTQELVRIAAEQEGRERAGLTEALEGGDLERAARHASALARLDPFDPGLQIDVRQVEAGIGEEVLRHLERGKAAYAAGQRETARREFATVLALDPRNQTALGYLSYIHRFEELEAEHKVAPPPTSISRGEILAEGHYRSAREAESAGEPFWAITEYEAAISVNKEHRSARRDLRALRGRLEPQIEELYDLGKQYFQEEDLHNALRAWRRVLLIDPRHERTLENVERAERMLSRLEEIQTSGS